jgi:NitT/TauT family transport system ATP-binding protein
VLKDISFEVGQGEIVAVLGHSGCGKTTLLHAVAGLGSGEGAVVEGDILLPREAKIGFVFQEPRLLPWRTVSGNIEMPLEIAGVDKVGRKEKLGAILAVLGLSEFAEYYPRQLSVGMQQRVNFGRALIADPNVIFLDEPFSALDVENKKRLQEEFLAIIKKKNNIAVIFVTHSIEEANFMADRIIILAGSPSTVKATIVKRNGMDVPARDVDFSESNFEYE